MGILTDIARLFVPQPVQTRSLESFEFSPLGEAVKQWRGAGAQAWRRATIREALGVPAIHRAVSLIANTTGSLSLHGYRNGAVMDEPPRIVQRPDPFQTPREFYRDSAYYMASRGEVIWWVAARDFDGLPASLIVVPLQELTIEPNPSDRLFPIYRWGKKISTRFSPITNQVGEFVHVTYLKEPGELRGKGPLQYCGAAISVTVEAQQWAANFFAGDISSVELQSQVDITEEEANALREQWMSRGETGTPRVTGPTLNWKEHQVDPESAQMVEARTHQDGEAARMFGIPGKLLEYSAPGSSLTYQNLAEVFTDFVRSCLAINYLEPIEQALTDLLPRSTTARFAIEGLLRADIKTRYEVYKTGIESGVLDPAEARRMEGLDPGDIEVAPVPYAPPTAVPAALPETRTDERADLLLETMVRTSESMALIASREPQIPTVTVHPAAISIEAPPPSNVTIEAGAIQVQAPPPAEVNVTTPEVRVDVAAPDMSAVAEALRPPKRSVRIERDGDTVRLVEDDQPA